MVFSVFSEWLQKFKFLYTSCIVKWFHEMELRGPYLYNYIDACSFHYRFCRIQAATALWRIPMLPGVILTETSRTFYEAANKTMLWPFTQPRRSPRPKALTWRPHPRPPTPRWQQHRRRLRRPRRRRIRCKRQQPRLRIAVPHLRLRLLCFFDAR